MSKENIIKDKSYQFSIKLIRFHKVFVESEKEFIISRQLLRSGTAIGALVEEANQAESKADFIHKLSIANKEAFETHYWLRLLKDTYLKERQEEILPLLDDSEELLRILTAIIKSTKTTLKK